MHLQVSNALLVNGRNIVGVLSVKNGQTGFDIALYDMLDPSKDTVVMSDCTTGYQLSDTPYLMIFRRQWCLELLDLRTSMKY